MNSIEKQLCDIQGRLFERSLAHGFDSCDFICKFMNSDVALHLDLKFDFFQWAGEAYLLDALCDEVRIEKTERTFSKDALYWAGYVYRYWHYYKNLSSKEIYKIADAKTMAQVYLSYHTLDTEMAIDRLCENADLSAGGVSSSLRV